MRDRSLIPDEVWALSNAEFSWHIQLASIRADFVHPPLMYAIERLWIEAFGILGHGGQDVADRDQRRRHCALSVPGSPRHAALAAGFGAVPRVLPARVQHAQPRAHVWTHRTARDRGVAVLGPLAEPPVEWRTRPLGTGDVACGAHALLRHAAARRVRARRMVARAATGWRSRSPPPCPRSPSSPGSPTCFRCMRHAASRAT